MNDTHTLFQLIAIVSMAMAGGLAVTAYRRHPEMFLWAAGLGVHAAAYALFGLRGQISDVLSIVVANTLLSVTLALFCAGIYHFQGRAPQHWLVWLPVPVTLLGFTWFLEQASVRAILSTLQVGFQFGLLSFLVLQKREESPGRGKYILITGGLIIILLMVARLIGLWAGLGQVAAVNTSSTTFLLPYYGGLVGTLLAGLGLVLMVQERAEYALQQSRGKEHLRSHILERLSSGASLTDVLEALVLGLERINPGKLCSVVLLNQDGTHLMDSVAPSLSADYNAALRGLPIGEGVGACGTAAYRGERVVIEDIATHPFWSQYRELAAKAGLRSCWSQPIWSSEHRVLGTFAIYQRQAHAPSPADIAMIEETTQLVSLAIERSTAATRLSESERHYRKVIESANEGICIISDGRFRFVNPRMQQMVGYTTSDLESMSYLDLTHPEDRAQAQANHLKRLLGQADDLIYETRILTKDLGPRWFQVTGVLFDWQGQPATLVFLTDVHERRTADERIRQLAFHDSLTQLPNRRLLLDRLQQTLAHNQRSGKHAALLFLDLDNFKPINDAHGHAVGDLLLVEVAMRLSHCIRAMDTVARFGGDEFVLLLTELHADREQARLQAQSVADKVLEAVAQPYQISLDHVAGLTVTHRCTTSIGCSLFVNAPAGPAPLIDEADAAMYQAKAAGRNTLSFYTQRH